MCDGGCFSFVNPSLVLNPSAFLCNFPLFIVFSEFCIRYDYIQLFYDFLVCAAVQAWI